MIDTFCNKHLISDSVRLPYRLGKQVIRKAKLRGGKFAELKKKHMGVYNIIL